MTLNETYEVNLSNEEWEAITDDAHQRKHMDDLDIAAEKEAFLESSSLEDYQGSGEDYHLEDDPDAAYEKMREEIGDMLYEDLKEVFKKYYFSSKPNMSYYAGKNNLEKLKQHAITEIQAMTPENLEVKE